jgi:alkanesulfonate monooxygenase SsuD/methylene tetrahydromethanopterin reductase-like flavin-dependent oxidoreductase (luciferase family)
LISDDMVRTIGIVGTPEECAAEIGRRFGAHVDEICCYFPYYKASPDNIRDLVTALHAQ